MMLHKKSQSSHLLKLLALVPIIGTALALNARTVTDYVYDEPQKKQIIKKGHKAGTIKMANQTIEVIATESAPKEQQVEGETFKMRGIVKDKEKGEPIVGAVIRIANSKHGTVTDMNGEFSIDVKKGDAVIASYVGYASDATIIKESQSKLVFILERDGSNESEGQKPFDVIEQMPQFPEGPAALMEYLSKNVRYPEEAHKNGIQGRVIVTFVVEKDGNITEARVAKSVNPLLDAEALRVVNAMPKWTPGMQGGEPVRTKYTVPITFKLDGGQSLTKPATEEKYILEIDGKVVDNSEIANIPPGEVANMQVIKAENGQPKKILITTKKKK